MKRTYKNLRESLRKMLQYTLCRIGGFSSTPPVLTLLLRDLTIQVVGQGVGETVRGEA